MRLWGVYFGANPHSKTHKKGSFPNTPKNRSNSQNTGAYSWEKVLVALITQEAAKRAVEPQSNPGQLEGSKGQSQPQIAADIRLLNSLHGSGSTMLVPEPSKFSKKWV